MLSEAGAARSAARALAGACTARSVWRTDHPSAAMRAAICSLGRLAGQAEKRLGVAGRDLGGRQGALDLGGEGEQADGVRHRGPAAAQAHRDRVVRQPEGVGEPGVRRGLLDR